MPALGEHATIGGMRRTTVLALLAGILLGVAGTLAVVEVSGGRYVYFTLPSDRCQSVQVHAEVVPNQPNPCHFREPRWSFIY